MADDEISTRLAQLLDELEAPASADDVEVVIDADGTTTKLWINVSGRCAFRISRIAQLTITDRRQSDDVEVTS